MVWLDFNRPNTIILQKPDVVKEQTVECISCLRTRLSACLISRKKKGFRDMSEESEYLYYNMKEFSLDPAGPIRWDRIEREIAYLEH